MPNQPSLNRRTFLDTTTRTVMAASGCLLCSRALAAESAIPKGKPGYQLVAPCGIYCGACEGLMKSLHAKAPSKEGCRGCLSDQVPNWSERQCKVRVCALKKGVESCAVCPEYPCDLLKEFQKQGWQKGAAANLRAIKEKGLAKWKQEMKARWSCKNCDSPFCDKDKKCRKCGKPVASTQ